MSKRDKKERRSKKPFSAVNSGQTNSRREQTFHGRDAVLGAKHCKELDSQQKATPFDVRYYNTSGKVK